MRHTFPAHGPQDVVIDLQSGSVRLAAVPIHPPQEVAVEITGARADLVRVEQRDNELVITGPRGAGSSRGSHAVAVSIVVPAGSALATKLGAADVRTTGELEEVRIRTGSGQVDLESVTGDASVKTGSGDITVGRLGGSAELKAGSGAIYVDDLTGEGALTTGSGAIRVRRAASAVSLKSGSGDLTVNHLRADAILSSASGALRVDRVPRGRVRLKNVAGDIRVGIPSGTPVWTDVSSATGSIYSSLAPTGAPRDGQDHVEVHAKAVTGDVYLDQILTTPPTGSEDPS